MLSIKVAFLAVGSLWLTGVTDQSLAQSLRLGPGGVEILPAPEVAPPPRRAPPPPVRDELRDRMLQLREDCEDGNRRSCVRLGIIIGENRERRATWRREHPEVFFYEER
jgi:hypothetical protein